MSDIDALKNCYLNPYDIFWIKNNGKKILLVRCGELASRAIEKIENKNIRLEFEDKRNFDWIVEGKEYLEGLKSFDLQIKNRERSKAKLREEFIEWLFSRGEERKFWNGNFVFLFEDIIKNLNENLSKDVFECDVNDYWRAFKNSSIFSILALVVGYNDYKFMEDIFSSLLYCEMRTLLDKNSSTFLELHSKRSLQKSYMSVTGDFKKEIDDHFKPDFRKRYNINISKSLDKAIEVHHEDFYGDGFPKKLKGNELNDLELLYVGISHLEFENEFDAIWTKVIDLYDKKPGGERISGMVKRIREEYERHDNEYLEVSGL
ncbi:hypothetical protein OAT67_01450 [Bacteriovoracaceae bacterium]|nr:hypothetical protein [Bacteriovoracaceae bacterium]